MSKVVYGQKLYYSSLTDDDFANYKAPLTKPVDGTYRYQPRNILFRICAFLLYYVIAYPALWIICKLRFGIKVVGKKNVRGIKSGVMFYSNHVNALDCAFAMIFGASPRRAYIVCGPDAVHIPFLRTIVRLLGVLPVPSDMAGYRNFNRAIDDKLKARRAVVVMPEAHIWPYCTFIRPYPATSFVYAARNGVPAVPLCVTYRKPKGPFKSRRRPRVTYYVGEPVYPEEGLSIKQNAQNMRDKVFAAMCAFAEKNEVALYEYVQTDEKVNTRGQIGELKRQHKRRKKNKENGIEPVDNPEPAAEVKEE